MAALGVSFALTMCIPPSNTDGTGAKLVSGDEINFSMDVISKLILGPPGTQVTLDIIRQQSGTRSRKWFKFAFYRQKPLSNSPDIRSPGQFCLAVFYAGPAADAAAASDARQHFHSLLDSVVNICEGVARAELLQDV